MNAKRFANTWSDVGWVKALKNNVNVAASPIASGGVKVVEKLEDVLGRDDAARMNPVEACEAILAGTIWMALKVAFVMVKIFKSLKKKLAAAAVVGVDAEE